MKIRVLSDLHMEFWKEWNPYHYQYQFDWVNKRNDVLILAGDIHVGPAKLKAALEHFASASNHVIYVPGNHEYYGYNLQSYDNLELPDNVHWLDNDWVAIEDIIFIGATLWTDFHNDPIAEHAALFGITDFKRIKNFSTKDCINRHLRDASFLSEAISSFSETKVIVTHFLPSPQCISPYWKKNGGVLNKYFAANLDEFINSLEGVPYWFFGHTHDSVNLCINDTNFIANPLGYKGYEINPNFNPGLEYEI